MVGGKKSGGRPTTSESIYGGDGQAQSRLPYSLSLSLCLCLCLWRGVGARQLVPVVPLLPVLPSASGLVQSQVQGATELSVAGSGALGRSYNSGVGASGCTGRWRRTRTASASGASCAACAYNQCARPGQRCSDTA